MFKFLIRYKTNHFKCFYICIEISCIKYDISILYIHSPILLIHRKRSLDDHFDHDTHLNPR